MPGKKRREAERGWHFKRTDYNNASKQKDDQRDELTTDVATDFYVNVTLISPCGSPGVLHDPVRCIPYEREEFMSLRGCLYLLECYPFTYLLFLFYKKQENKPVCNY